MADPMDLRTFAAVLGVIEKDAGIWDQAKAYGKGAVAAGRGAMQSGAQQQQLGQAMGVLGQAGHLAPSLHPPTVGPAQGGVLSQALAGGRQAAGHARAADEAVAHLRQVQKGEGLLHGARATAAQHGVALQDASGMPNFSAMAPHDYLASKGLDAAHYAPKTPPGIPLPASAAAHASAPTASPAAPPAPAAAAPSTTGAPAVNSPSLNKYMLPAAAAAGVGAMGYSAYKGMGAANEQDARIRDLVASRQGNLTAPLPSMTVHASYDERAEAKLAALKTAGGEGGGGLPSSNVYHSVGSAASGAIAKSLSDQLIAQPLDALGGLIKKKLYTQPKQRHVFNQVTGDDPILSRAMAENPAQLHEAYKAMRDFGPSLSVNPSATRSFLRQATMAGGNLDYATIRMLAETEKFIQNSKGRGSQY